jgi:hypothetical protein
MQELRGVRTRKQYRKGLETRGKKISEWRNTQIDMSKRWQEIRRKNEIERGGPERR